jgi:cytochrome c553
VPSFPSIPLRAWSRAALVPACLAWIPGSRADAADPEAFFEQRIRPLLVESCLECHGATKQKGGLRLDHRDGWAIGGDSGPALVPGNPEASRIVHAVRYGNPKLQMPPRRKLSPRQISDLEQWVALGAPDPRAAAPATATAGPRSRSGLDLETARSFWSFRPIARPAVPEPRDAAWPRTDLDRFVRAAQEARGLVPAPDADRLTLLRRAAFTLTGLPPTPEEADAFLGDPRPDDDAFADVVDRMLDSPAFGERWGRLWLDLARFAESSGGGRTLLFKDAWRYRDYVIDSVNRDVPWDRFIREQLAGDLLPAATPEDQGRLLVATAFLALGPTNYEEQDKKQLRFDIIDEQIDTVGKAFLGMTLGCARCHDHKFDPVPTADYYALAGIFASTRTLHNETDNVARWIETPLPLPGPEAATFAALERDAAALDSSLRKARAEVAALRKSRPALAVAAGRPVSPGQFPGHLVDDAQATAVGAWTVSRFSPSYIGDGYRHDDNAGKGEKSLTFEPKLAAAGVHEVRLAYNAAGARASNVPVTVFHADGETTLTVDQRAEPPLDGRFVSLGRFRFEPGGPGFVLVSNQGTDGHVIADAVQWLPVRDADADADAPASGETGLLAGLEQDVARMERELKAVRARLAARPVAMTVREQDPAKIGDTAIRARGLVHNEGPVVPRGFLRAASPGTAPRIPAGESGRRQLADWIVDPGHPLTARVLANRVWTWLFGVGLVRSTDNFGATGELPSHPELLDFLASRFARDHGWSAKSLVREIVLSRAWQTASSRPAASAAADPDHRFLTAYPPRRLDAEQIRDAILTFSGRLDRTYGGPNIRGAGGIDANTTAAQDTEYGYVFADTRRGVYTPAFRARRLDLFEVFDFGNANLTMGQRPVSTVSLQALYLLNNPFVITEARHAAARLLAGPDPGDDARIERLHRLALGRLPSAEERSLAREFLRDSASPGNGGQDAAEAWAGLCQAVIGSIDFRYLR